MEASLYVYATHFSFSFWNLSSMIFSLNTGQFYSFKLKSNIKRWNNNFQKCPQDLIWNSHKQLKCDKGFVKCKNCFRINVVEPKVQRLHWNDVE